LIIDSSALMAIILREPDGRTYLHAIVTASSCRMSVSNWLEATMMVDSRGQTAAADRLDRFIRQTKIEVVPVSLSQGELARQAWRTYGKGNHPAHLNYGDCFAYALAKETGEPLLFKGTDFAQTDIEPALKAAP
jgi:ribonuclease VapC